MISYVHLWSTKAILQRKMNCGMLSSSHSTLTLHPDWTGLWSKSAKFLGDDSPFLGPMSGSETGAGRQHTQSNKPCNINLRCQIYCKGTHESLCMHTHWPKTRHRDSCPVTLCLIQIDSGWRNDWTQWDVHSTHRGGRGGEHGDDDDDELSLHQGSLCKLDRRNTACLGFCRNISSGEGNPKAAQEPNLQNLSIKKTNLWISKDRRWLHFHVSR